MLQTEKVSVLMLDTETDLKKRKKIENSLKATQKELAMEVLCEKQNWMFVDS